MFRARIKDSGREVFAAQIGDKPAWYTDKQPLICSKCNAGVHGKGTYVKRNGASYRAHFALNPRTSHEEACPFNPVEFIASIARGAKDLAHVEDGVLKLTLPGDVEDLAPPPQQANPHLPPHAVTAQSIDTVAPLLPPLLNCAAKIAQFLQLNAFDDTVVKRFKVQPHGHKGTIPWGRFCYGPAAAAYGELVRRLDPDGPGRAPSHPVAVYGTVQRVHQDRKGRPFVFLADHTDLDGQEFEVVLRSMHPTLIEPLTVGTHVLAVGAWGTFPDGRVPQLRLFAEEAWQIAYWHTDEDTGSATQPVSPPAVTARQRATERHARGPSQRASRPTRAGQRPAAPTRRTTPPPPVPPAPPVAPAPPRPALPAEAPDVAQRGPQPRAPLAPSTAAPRTPPPAPDDVLSAGSPAEQPAIPPRPAHPPLPTSPPPPPTSRWGKGLSGWLGRRRKRRS
ncbi:hypothetical protein ACFYZ8_34555 [Streptomyces sp. NPDC001668]|uniref:hypothetical protein n=1 Tax=Streptomyces sp. NPDC001668 TaxID=3364598 RepID=UPI003694707E